MNLVNKEAEYDEWEINEKIWKPETTVPQQKVNGLFNQIKTKVKDGENGLNGDKCRPKRRKWKSQGRNHEGKGGNKDGLTKMKRSANCLNWESPNSKKPKENTLRKFVLHQRAQPHTTVATKLRLENEECDEMEELPYGVNELSAMAKIQPRRQL